MEPLKRIIGYVKPELRKDSPKNVAAAETIIPAKKEPIQQINPEQEVNKSKKIVAWITSHPEFKWSAMCKKLKYDKGNFQRILKSDNPIIKTDLIPKIEEVLKSYGYEC